MKTLRKCIIFYKIKQRDNKRKTKPAYVSEFGHFWAWPNDVIWKCMLPELLISIYT